MLNFGVAFMPGLTLHALQALEAKIKKATADALNQTAKDIISRMPSIMEEQLDRPTNFTKNSLYHLRATPDRLTAVVGIKDRQASYLKYVIGGGTKAAGPRGIKLPADIVLNEFGNIPKGAIDKLKQAAQGGGFSKALIKRLGGKQKLKSGQIQLFFGKPDGARWANAPVAIWRRDKAGGKLVPVVVFSQKPSRYKRKFHFVERGHQIAGMVLEKHFWAALTSL